MQLQVNRVLRIIDGRIKIRRELARSASALASQYELDILLGELEQSISAFPNSCLSLPGARIQGAGIDAVRDQEARRLSAHAHREIEILKKELALNLHEKTERPSSAVTVTVSGGSAIVNTGVIYGDVQQVISHLAETGGAEIADVLRQLAKAINDAEALADGRVEYLEQVKFIAEQAALPAPAPQRSVVKGLVGGFCAKLQGVANVAQILSVAGPVMAHHFGFPWPL
jgi:hypothetical protein